MKTRSSLIAYLQTQDLWAADGDVVFDLARQLLHRSDLDWTASFARQGASAGPAGPVVQLPIYGMLEQRSSILDEFFGTTSYQAVRDAFRTALRDPATRAIVLDIDSPGGVAMGTTELANEIRAARGGNVRIVASISGLGCSAAYWLASQADEIFATPSSLIGSIGIIAVHQEISRMLEAEGVTTTIFATPPAKSEGNPLEPLTDGARAAITERQTMLYESFVNDVAKGRRTTVPRVKADFGEGRAWLASKALSAGMIDGIETLDATVIRLQRTIGTGRSASRMGAASDWISFGASPIAVHKTGTSDAAWDGGAEEAKIPDDAGEDILTAFYAWQDPEADPETKAAYKFDHHFTAADGTAGDASTVACSSGIGYCNRQPGQPGRPGIPDADFKGVHAHLAAHLRDAGMEPPALTGATFSERMVALTAEAVDLASAARFRARSRTGAGRPAFSTTTEAALRASRDAFDELLSGEPGDPLGEPAPSSGAPAPTPRELPPVSREEFLAKLSGVRP